MTAHRRLPRKIGYIDKAKLDKYAPYIAGLLDGEATFTIHWNKDARASFIPLIVLQMTHEGVIDLVANVFQVSYDEKKRINKRPFYLLRVTTQNDIVMILETLMPHLIVKEEHAKIMLELIDLKSRTYTHESVTKMAELFLKIKQLSTKGPPVDFDKLKSELDQHIENWFK